MIIHDISLPISESLVTWPTHSPIRINQPRHLEKGDHATVSEIRMSAHTGTHVDAPNHFIPKGSGVDALDLNLLVGMTLVVDATRVEKISASELPGMQIPDNTDRVLFRTRNSERWHRNQEEFFEDYVGITPSGADWLIKHGVRLVGIDSLSVATFDQSVPTHKALLGAGITIVEGLYLEGISPGMYKLVCLPIKLMGLDGAPARAILIELPR
jgi:arylformamidase